MDVTIDFVAFDPQLDAWLLVLVEPGPWTDATVNARLVALQNRLYGCLEAALDGQIAERFPEAADAKVIVRADCYDCYGTARDEVDAFIRRFSAGVRDIPDYSPASSPWVRSLEIEATYDQIH
jgi:hypothetical protein